MAGGLPAPRERVDPRARLLWTLRGLGVAALVAAVAWAIALGQPGFLPAAVLDRAVLAAALLTAGGLAAAPLAAAVRYRIHRWELADDVLVSLEGLLVREWRIVPLARVQTVESGQGPLERVLGLAGVTVSTASHAGSSRIEGLAEPVAAELARRAAERANELRAGDGT